MPSQEITAAHIIEHAPRLITDTQEIRAAQIAALGYDPAATLCTNAKIPLAEAALRELMTHLPKGFPRALLEAHP
ncbi:MAG: hypothetical protein WAO98_04470 [Alphaproteobacteria bacterium]